MKAKKKKRSRRQTKRMYVDAQIKRLEIITERLCKLVAHNELSDNLKICNSNLHWLRYNVKLSVDTDRLLNEINDPLLREISK